jgi:Protein of unknown function (DUF3014)
MNDSHDYDLHPTLRGAAPEEPPPSPIKWWIAAALLAVAVGVVVYVVVARRSTPAPEATAPPPAAPVAEAPRSLGGEAEPVVVPPLNESDPVVRMLARALSEHPVVAAWLATNGLIRNFTVVVVSIGEGNAPAKQLSVLKPASPFAVFEANGKSYVDTKSYNRYSALADAVASVDSAGAAKLYATLKPRIEEAYGELGSPDRRFDQVLEQAIVAVLGTPTLNSPLQVKPADEGIGYAFTDARLERMSDAQKQLLRMGPRNAQIIKAKLREIGVALGIPPSRLPPE